MARKKTIRDNFLPGKGVVSCRISTNMEKDTKLRSLPFTVLLEIQVNLQTEHGQARTLIIELMVADQILD